MSDTPTRRDDDIGGAAAPRVCRVVVDVGPAHLDRPFDYLLGAHMDAGVGSRLRVRFHGRARTAWVTGLPEEASADARPLLTVDAVDGDVRWFDHDDIAVWRWIADRYAGTLSGVIRHALPPRVARVETEAAGWAPAPPPTAVDRPPCASDGWRSIAGSALLRAASAPQGRAFHLRAPLNGDEGSLIADLVTRCLAAGRTALVVAPSPATGPADDVLAAAGTIAADLRGDRPDAERYRAFLRARRGDVRVLVGERSVALTPLPDLGLVVVLDEAGGGYKERRNPRHHVREALLARARMTGATAVLTSSVMSAHAWRHHTGGHLALVRADRGHERAAAPRTLLVDRRALPPAQRRTRLTGPVAERIAATVDASGSVVVLAAQRGSGTSLACAECRTRHECRICGGGVSPAPAAGAEAWRCGACGWVGPAFACIDCGGTDSVPLRAGAKTFAGELSRTHPDADVAVMEGFDAPGPSRRPAIAVMTRGSVVLRPTWLRDEPDGRADLLVVADPDVLLGRPAVDAAEDALRLWFDGARLARQVVLQTAQPAHPAVQAFVRSDPDGFWADEADRRRPLGFPPTGSLVRFAGLTDDAAAAVRDDVPGSLLGPGPDGVALLKTDDLRGTLTALHPLRRRWGRDDVRVRVDVDPESV